MLTRCESLGPPRAINVLARPGRARDEDLLVLVDPAAGARPLSAFTVAAATLMATLAAAAVVVRQPLTATSKAPNAKGRAKLVVKTPSKGKFTVAARGLPAGSTFDV